MGAAHENFIENQAYPWQNHLIGAALDTLALYRAFESLVGSLQFDKEAVTYILRAASRDSLSSLETAANWLIALFPDVADISGAISGNVAVNDRSTLHDTVIGLGNYFSLPSTPAHTFTSLESITTASTIKGLSALGTPLVAHFDDAVPGTYGEYQMVAQNVTRHAV